MKKKLKHAGIIACTFFLTLLLLFTWLLWPGFQSIKTSPYPIPTQSSTSWENIFESPRDITVEPIVTAVTKGDFRKALDQNDPNIKYIDTAKPLYSLVFLLHHKENGYILIDAGLDSSYAKNPPYGDSSQFMALVYSVMGMEASQAMDQNIAQQLSNRNIHVPQIFLTHLHDDHVAGLKDLPDDIEIVFGKSELTFSAKVFMGYPFAGKTNIKTLDFSSAKPVEPFDAVLDVLGDGSLWAISTPGHSPDHISFLVNSKTGPILITGDAAHTYTQFEYGIKVIASSEEAQHQSKKTMGSIKKLMKQYPHIEMFVGHDLPKSH